MNIKLALHKEPPTSPELAVQNMPRDLDAVHFLTEAIQRVSGGIKPGETREVGISIKVSG